MSFCEGIQLCTFVLEGFLIKTYDIKYVLCVKKVVNYQVK